LEIRVRRTLRGHIAKVLEFDFCENQPDLIVSASQDGKLIVWNGLTTNKLFVIPLKSQWVLTCGFAPGGRLVSCGGLDNTVYLFKLNEDESIPTESNDLKGHEGSIFRTRFYDDEHVISCSGDKSAVLWNINQSQVESTFWGHTHDVLCVDVAPEKHIFITGSIDPAVYLWDRRNAGQAVLSFTGHEFDINSVKFFPNKNAFVTSSDDGSVRLYDIRGDRELMVYQQPTQDPSKVQCACFSSSGKYIFAACANMTYIFNTITGESIGTLKDEEIVSWVGVNPSGKALYTASWKNFIKVYA